MSDLPDPASWVKLVMAGKDYRVEGERIDLHFTTLYDLAKGRRKSRDTIVKFARGFGQDPNYALRVFGMEPDYKSDVSPAEYYKIRAFDLWKVTEELEIPARRGWFHGGQDEAFTSREQVDETIRQQVEDLIKDYPEHASELRAFLEGGS